MNSLDAAVAKEGAGIVRVLPRRAEPDPAAGRPVQLLVDCGPGPAPLHLMFQPSRLASPKIRNLRPLRRRRWRSLDPFNAYPAHERNHCSILKPCQMAVVYQAADQTRFIAS